LGLQVPQAMSLRLASQLSSHSYPRQLWKVITHTTNVSATWLLRAAVCCCMVTKSFSLWTKSGPSLFSDHSNHHQSGSASSFCHSRETVLALENIFQVTALRDLKETYTEMIRRVCRWSLRLRRNIRIDSRHAKILLRKYPILYLKIILL
jgi:hypothetical protein